MTDADVVKLYCGVYEEATVFPVQIARDAEVSALQKAIFDDQRYQSRFEFPPNALTLYLARKDGEWLSGGQDVEDMLRGEVDTSYPKMFPWWKLNKVGLLGPDFTPGEEEIQVLVKVPQSAGLLGKRRLSSARRVKLRDLWAYSEIHIEKLPKTNELHAMLRRPLPFRLELGDGVEESICDRNGDLLECTLLQSLIHCYLSNCEHPIETVASENTWQDYYSGLLRIATELCYAKGMRISCRRNLLDATGTTVKGLRPDFILQCDGLVLLRGEEKSSLKSIGVSRKELTKKMVAWNPMFYGDLPYILGYASSGEQLEIVAIDRHLHAVTIFEGEVVKERESVIKVFYNLAFLFHAMTTLSKRTCESSLMPFIPDISERRTIELMDDCVRRTINHDQCRDEDEFERLIGIYKTLEHISRQEHGRTHLQTVRKLKLPDEENRRLCVKLQPLGFSRQPENVEEVREWLVGMLTALTLWHSCDYCHGDIRWPNIVYVPTSGQGYWVLIDMDESHRQNTTRIEWNHQLRGELLTFQHDLYQLGCLMDSLQVPLTDTLKKVRTALLSAVASKLRAEQAWAMMRAKE